MRDQFVSESRVPGQGIVGQCVVRTVSTVEGVDAPVIIEGVVHAVLIDY
jgi:hypothetical protein